MWHYGRKFVRRTLAFAHEGDRSQAGRINSSGRTTKWLFSSLKTVTNRCSSAGRSKHIDVRTSSWRDCYGGIS